MDESLSDLLETNKDKLRSKILHIDSQFIDSICIVCPLCDSKKKHKEYYTNAKFLEGEYGYIYHCCKCMEKKETITLNQFLKLACKDAKGHAKARWEIGSTGYGFNCPNPPDAKSDYLLKRIENTGTDNPKKAAEIYKRQAQKRKEENYRKKYGKEI